VRSFDLFDGSQATFRKAKLEVAEGHTAS